MPVRSKQPRDDDPASLSSRPSEAQRWLKRSTPGFDVASIERDRSRPLEAHFADAVVAAEFEKKYRAAYRDLVSQNDGDPPKHNDVAKKLGLSDYRFRERRRLLGLPWPPPRLPKD